MAEHEEYKDPNGDVPVVAGAASDDALLRAEAKAQEYLDGWQRARADFANAEKRHMAALQASRDEARIEALRALLPALDSLERALEDTTLPGAVRTGLLQVLAQLKDGFRTLGITPFSPLGEAFTPERHEPVGTVPAAGEDVDRVREVLANGWTLGDRVIRPAKVIVSTGD